MSRGAGAGLVTPLGVTLGGTGAQDAAAARVALGVPDAITAGVDGQADRYTTLAALQAVTSSGSTAIAYVEDDGGNDGSYRANGSGGWTRYSTATISSLNNRLTALGSLDVAPMDAPNTIAQFQDPTTKRVWIEGFEDGSAQGDFRKRDGSALISAPEAQAMVDLLGAAQVYPPLEEPDTIAQFQDPTTKRVWIEGKADGSARGDWRNWDGTRVAYPTELYAPWRLRRTREKLQRLKANASGLGGFGGQFVAAAIGNSWDGSLRNYGQQLFTALTQTFGFSGTGWIQANLAVDAPNPGMGINNDAPVQTSAGWNYQVPISAPGIAGMTSSTVGEWLTLEMPTGNTAINVQMRGVGQVRYNWNGGSWITLDVPTGLLASYALSGVPGGGVGGTLRIEVVSGPITIYGLDLRNGSAGVRWNKIGRSGTSTADWTSFDPTDFIAGLTALSPDYVPIMHSVNCQFLSTLGGVAATPNQHAANLNTLIDWTREAVPSTDIMLITQPEVRVASASYAPMVEYARAARSVAEERATAHLNLQFAFGEQYADYAYGAPHALLDNSFIHPSGPEGRSVIAETMWRALVNSTS